ncbi:hypothetical protein ALI22I_42875 [Saccharothrix sp. ALI-22-I]|nr:hypothetical protein ALI22I_42875 [Saccharothrix sp. ALI-22-I]
MIVFWKCSLRSVDDDLVHELLGYERAFCGRQFEDLMPVFEESGVQLWLPEAGGRVDFTDDAHRTLMNALGAQSEREVVRTRNGVIQTMRAQTCDQAAGRDAVLRSWPGKPRWSFVWIRDRPAVQHTEPAPLSSGRRRLRCRPVPCAQVRLRGVGRCGSQSVADA